MEGWALRVGLAQWGPPGRQGLSYSKPGAVVVVVGNVQVSGDEERMCMST